MQIAFESNLIKIGTRLVMILPPEISLQLPSRGMVMVSGTINGVPVVSPLEPDGKGSHWLEVGDTVRSDAGIALGDSVSLSVEVLDEWPEPEMPADIMNAIEKAGLMPQWFRMTTKAHWEWLRWIRSTSNPETRSKRIQVACSKMEKGSKRPCCFDASSCTVPDVSKSGVLMHP